MGFPGTDFPVWVSASSSDGAVPFCSTAEPGCPNPATGTFQAARSTTWNQAEDAGRRETLEETGLAIGEMHFLCVYEYRSAEDGHHWVSLIYVTEDFTGEPRVMEPEKLPEFGWFDIDALPEKVSKFTLHAVGYL